MQTGTQHKKLSLRHSAFQPEQKPIIERRGIIESLFVQNQGVGEGTDFQQMMPITGVTCQARNLQTQDQSHMPQSDLSHESLERKARSAVEAPE